MSKLSSSPAIVTLAETNSGHLAAFESTVRALAVVYLFIFGLESAIRYALSLIGASEVIYIRDGLLLVIIALCVYTSIQQQRDIKSTVICLGVLYASVCLGFLSGLPGTQVVFGIKVLLPFITGFMLVTSGLISSLDRRRIWLILWALICIGLLLNRFHRFPWSGLIVTVGDVDIEANREWNAQGHARLSGFSRTSYDAAMLILLLHLYLISTERRLRGRLLLTFVSGLAIVLTTSKGAVGALIVTTMFIPIFDAIRRSANMWRAPCAMLLVVLGAFGLIAPLVTTQMAYPTFQNGSTEMFLFGSMVDRGWETWPKAFALLHDWQLVLGRGVGGIGAGQQYFEPGLMNPADNMFVWLYVTAGIMGAAFYIALLLLSVRLDPKIDADCIAYLMLICMFAYGISANIMESAIFSSALGAITAYLCTKGPRAVAPDVKRVAWT